eukprot:1161620-Pelagomonas_calceolata.AAC.8
MPNPWHPCVCLYNKQKWCTPPRSFDSKNCTQIQPFKTTLVSMQQAQVVHGARGCCKRNLPACMNYSTLLKSFKPFVFATSAGGARCQVLLQKENLPACINQNTMLKSLKPCVIASSASGARRQELLQKEILPACRNQNTMLKSLKPCVIATSAGGARRQELLQEKLARQRELALVAEEAAERRRLAEAARQAGLSDKARKKEQAQVPVAADAADAVYVHVRACACACACVFDFVANMSRGSAQMQRNKALAVAPLSVSLLLHKMKPILIQSHLFLATPATHSAQSNEAAVLNHIKL